MKFKKYLVVSFLSIAVSMQAPDGMEGFLSGEQGFGTGDQFVSTKGLTIHQHEALVKKLNNDDILTRKDLMSNRDRQRIKNNWFDQSKIEQDGSVVMNDGNQSVDDLKIEVKNHVEATFTRLLGGRPIEGTLSERITSLVDALVEEGINPRDLDGQKRIVDFMMNDDNLLSDIGSNVQAQSDLDDIVNQLPKNFKDLAGQAWSEFKDQATFKQKIQVAGVGVFAVSVIAILSYLVATFNY